MLMETALDARGGARAALREPGLGQTATRCACCWRTCGIAYERRTLDVVDRSDRPEVLGGLNPSLRVPTLVLDDGRSLGESGAILGSSPTVRASSPRTRTSGAQVLQWMFFEQYDHEPNIAVAPVLARLLRTAATRRASGSRAGTRAATTPSGRWRATSTAATGSSATR
jgi:glutathione S-transferase